MHKDGSQTWDYVTTKFDPSFSLKPIRRERIRELLMALTQSVPVLIEYTGIKGETQVFARPTPSTVEFLTNWNGERIYGNATITFEER